MIPNRLFFNKAVADVTTERESQPPFDDSQNTEGCWVSYIVNYASRWALPFMFDPCKYNFRTCMVKVAALAIAAIEWCDTYDGIVKDFDSKQSQIVGKPIK